jgi:hypothetical protein
MCQLDDYLCPLLRSRLSTRHEDQLRLAKSSLKEWMTGNRLPVRPTGHYRGCRARQHHNLVAVVLPGATILRHPGSVSSYFFVTIPRTGFADGTV